MSKRKSTTIYSQKPAEEQIRISETLFDEKENILSETYYDEDGETVKSAIARTFDEKGNLLLEVRVLEGVEGQRREMEYDDKGRMRLEKSIKEGLLEARLEYDWNEESTEVEVFYYDDQENVFNKEVRKYDKNGNVLSEVFVDEEGEEVEGHIYTFDDKDNPITKVVKQGGFEMHSSYKNTYDKEGNLLEARLTDEDEEEEWDEYTYENGSLSAHTRVEMSGAKVVTYFDEKGRMKKQNQYDTTGYNINEISTFYGDDHEYVIARTVRRDTKFFKLVFEHEFFEAE